VIGEQAILALGVEKKSSIGSKLGRLKNLKKFLNISEI
jgi:hypothetical protein